nr:hypothetical protein [Tanacetum cinerariifolium]
MNNKKRIVNLEYFREMLHICQRIPNHTFDELPFKEEILAFLRYLGHNGEIKKITDVNINKLHQRWRSVAAVINKCLSGRSTGYDSLSLSQAQILWGMYHKKNIYFAYLLWEDFVYQVEHKDAKKSNEMYYPRFTKVIINFFMTKDPSISKRNKTKASVRKTQSSFDTTMPPQTVAGSRLSTSEKGKQPAKSSKAKDEGTAIIPGVPDVPTYEYDEEIYWKLSDEDDDDDDGDEGLDAEDDDEELYRDVNINMEGRDVQMTDVHTTQVLEDTHVTLTPVNPDGIASLFESTHWVDVLVATTVVPLLVTAPTVPPQSIPIISQSNRLRDESQAENEDFLNKLDENIRLIIKEQVKEQVKTSYAVAADLSELELKKILIEKMESNKSIHRSEEQRNLYKALVDAYECDKIILDTYRDTVTLKRRRDNEDKDEEPSAGSDRGSKRRRAGKEPESTRVSKEKASKTSGKSTKSNLAKQADSRTSFNELMDTPVDFSAFLMNRLKVDTLTLELLAGLTYELMKGSCKYLVELEFFLEEVYKVTTDQLDWNNPEGQQYPHNLLKPLPLIPISSRKYTTYVTKTKVAVKRIEDLVPRTMWSQAPVSYDKYALWGISHWGRKRQRFYGFAANRESARDVYSKRRIIAATKLQIVECHNYKHLDWITVRRDDDKLYKFKEGYIKRLRVQDIEDMLLLLVQGKLTNLTVEKRLAFNVSLRVFTRSIIIQQRAKDLQLGVESYQKKLNLTKPDTYRSDLKRKEAYTAYSNPKGFIYQNKDKQNRLMRIDELHKFNDGTLNNVQSALDDRLKGIRMKYLPQTIWRRSDKERAAAMIQAIDKQLKTRRIM